jgi:hypothetical protein
VWRLTNGICKAVSEWLKRPCLPAACAAPPGRAPFFAFDELFGPCEQNHSPRWPRIYKLAQQFD